jgi:antitoxin (DNA-binding transcriptional repressor) of toxin-antitoxin stability system
MSERNVGVREFRENMSRYIAQAKAGSPITIMSHGKPVAELHAPQKKGVRPAPTFGGMKGQIWMADDWDKWDEDFYRILEAPISPDGIDP